MKKKQFTLMAVTFIAGIIIGVATLGLYSFTTTGAPPQTAMSLSSKITVKDAQYYLKNYASQASPINSIVKGFALNKEQVAAINQLAKENTSLTGFRVYLGFDDNASGVGIIVGINSSGQDVTTSIYKSSLKSSGPCPTICDGASSLIAN